MNINHRDNTDTVVPADYRQHTHGFRIAIIGSLIIIGIIVGAATAGPLQPPAGDRQPVVSAKSAEPVNMARATWDTGWFQAEIYKRLLEELGYPVNGPTTMGN